MSPGTSRTSWVVRGGANGTSASVVVIIVVVGDFAAAAAIDAAFVADLNEAKNLPFLSEHVDGYERRGTEDTTNTTLDSCAPLAIPGQTGQRLDGNLDNRLRPVCHRR